MSMTELPHAARRVQAALHALGLWLQVGTLPASTRTAAAAAAAVGCEVGQVVKSLIFRAATSDAPVLVLARGANRVDEARLAELVGEPIVKADAAFVRAHTGYA